MSRRHNVALLRAVIGGALLGLLVAQPVLANHMVPPLQYWWDLDDDRVKDEADSNIGYGSAGTQWTAEKHGDVWAATTEWRGSTRWDPFDASGGGTIRGTVRVDSALLCIADYFSDWPSAVFAVNCLQYWARKDGTIVDFYDLVDSDITINEQDHAWNYGSDDPAFSELDFRGVLTHELGHGVRLLDVSPPNCGSPIYTMCQPDSNLLQQGKGPLTKQLRSLTDHDRNAANVVYPL